MRFFDGKSVISFFSLVSAVNVVTGARQTPPLPGVHPGDKGSKVILAADIDYPPFSYLGPAAEDFPMTGFAVDFLYALEDVCDIEPYVVQTNVSYCWGHSFFRAQPLSLILMMEL